MEDADSEKVNSYEVANVLTKQEAHPTCRDKQDHAPSRTPHGDVETKSIQGREYKAENKYRVGHVVAIQSSSGKIQG